MTGLIKRTDIHTGKHSMHLIKQQHFDESHIHLCNIKTSARDTHTHTQAHMRYMSVCFTGDYSRQFTREERTVEETGTYMVYRPSEGGVWS